MSTFQSLGLSPNILKAIEAEGYKTPTPVQEQAIPPLLDGRDVLAVAQTGTGKTAAFSLPVLEIMNNRTDSNKSIKALILSPTRELAAQIDQRFSAYSKHMDISHMVIFGGVKQGAQVSKLRRGVDILVATPGRLLDLIGQGHIDITKVEFFVLDEADRMLDMGFIRDIRKVIQLLPKKRQNLLFSATMPKTIAELADSILKNAITIDVSPKQKTVQRITQKVMFVRKADKRRLLVKIIKAEKVQCAIVFTRTKHGANRLVKQLAQSGVDASAIHGNKSQGARTKALAGFKNGEIPILVATDIASRGIDVDDVTHVFNYDLPNEPESYVHRIGRTARAGKDGIAYAFCDESESGYLVGIEQVTGTTIPRDLKQEFHFANAIPKPGQKAGKMKEAKSSKPNNRNKKSPPKQGSSNNNNSNQNQGRGNRSNNNSNNNRSNQNSNSNSSQRRNNNDQSRSPSRRDRAQNQQRDD
jgi:ATP-dependent RNA helicase RhlE